MIHLILKPILPRGRGDGAAGAALRVLVLVRKHQSQYRLTRTVLEGQGHDHKTL